MVENNKETAIECGACKIIVGRDEKDRPTLTPYCPPDEKGNPKLSDEVKVLREVFQSDEVVLRPPKIKEE